MTRRGYDDIAAANVPADGDIYLGYSDGKWADAAAMAARFPGKKVVRITVNPADVEGDMLDVETGDATPDQAPDWTLKRRGAGAWPAVYCSQSVWAQVRTAFQARRIPEPPYGIAQYDNDPNIPQAWLNAGCVGKQYQSTPNYDIWTIVDYWPGVDDAPFAHPEELFPMSLFKSDLDAQRWFVRYAYYTLVHREPESEQALAGWLNILQNGGAEQMWTAIADSPEGQAQLGQAHSDAG